MIEGKITRISGPIVFALAIDWQWLAVADVVDEERNQLLRELIRAVVV